MPGFLLQLRRLPPQRPTAAAQGRHQQPALVQQHEAGATPPRLTLDSRPVLSQPAGDRAVVAFAGDPAGQLRGVPPLPEPASQIVGGKGDPKLLLNEQAEALGCPQLRSEAMIRRVVREPAADDLLLGGRQFGRPARNRSGYQAGQALPVEISKPATDTAGIDPEEVTDLLGRVALRKTLHGKQTPALQLKGGADASHTC